MCLAGARWQPDAVRQLPQRSTDLGLPGDARAAVVHRDPRLRAEHGEHGEHRGGGESGFRELRPAGRHAVDRDALATEGSTASAYFEDNRQCEEWALLRGDCPVGGLKVTGYVTPAARYCAITGGTYVVTGNSGQDDEQGTCTLVNGGQCDAWDYYSGKCASE